MRIIRRKVLWRKRARWHPGMAVVALVEQLLWLRHPVAQIDELPMPLSLCTAIPWLQASAYQEQLPWLHRPPLPLVELPLKSPVQKFPWLQAPAYQDELPWLHKAAVPEVLPEPPAVAQRLPSWFQSVDSLLWLRHGMLPDVPEGPPIPAAKRLPWLPTVAPVGEQLPWLRRQALLPSEEPTQLVNRIGWLFSAVAPPPSLSPDVIVMVRDRPTAFRVKDRATGFVVDDRRTGFVARGAKRTWPQ